MSRWGRRLGRLVLVWTSGWLAGYFVGFAAGLDVGHDTGFVAGQAVAEFTTDEDRDAPAGDEEAGRGVPSVERSEAS